MEAASEIQAARNLLGQVTIPNITAKPAIALVQSLGVDSLRAEITWFEAARAFTAADGRLEVTAEDMRAVAPMSLRLRRSKFMQDFFNAQENEEEEVSRLLKGFGSKPRPDRPAKAVKAKK